MMVDSINIKSFIAKEVRRAVAEEVNNFGVRAAVKSKIEEIGDFNRDTMYNLIEDVADSYVRSMHIESIVNKLINEVVMLKINEKVEIALRDYITGSPFSPSLTRDLREIVIDRVKHQLDTEYDLRIVNKKQEG